MRYEQKANCSRDIAMVAHAEEEAVVACPLLLLRRSLEMVFDFQSVQGERFDIPTMVVAQAPPEQSHGTVRSLLHPQHYSDRWKHSPVEKASHRIQTAAAMLESFPDLDQVLPIRSTIDHSTCTKTFDSRLTIVVSTRIECEPRADFFEYYSIHQVVWHFLAHQHRCRDTAVAHNYHSIDFARQNHATGDSYCHIDAVGHANEHTLAAMVEVVVAAAAVASAVALLDDTRHSPSNSNSHCHCVEPLNSAVLSAEQAPEMLDDSSHQCRHSHFENFHSVSLR